MVKSSQNWSWCASADSVCSFSCANRNVGDQITMNVYWRYSYYRNDTCQNQSCTCGKNVKWMVGGKEKYKWL